MYTVEQIAEMTGRSKEQVRRWIRSGKLKGETLHGPKFGKGRRIYVDEDDFKQFTSIRKYPINTYKPGSPKISIDKEENYIKLILEFARLETVVDQIRQKQRDILAKLKG